MTRLVDEGPPLAAAVLVVNAVGELGSFTLEFLLFLPVYLVAASAYDLLRSVVSARRGRPEEV
jgi:hypothetical protein